MVWVPTTTYGRSPTCITSASPSARTIADNKDSARATAFLGTDRVCAPLHTDSVPVTPIHRSFHLRSLPSVIVRHRERSATCRVINPNRSGITVT
jgi:hypothetical protein